MRITTVTINPEDDLYCVDDEGNCHTSDDTAERATKVAKRGEYDVVNNNCEHFATCARTGLSESSQTLTCRKICGGNLSALLCRLIGLVVLPFVAGIYKDVENNRVTYEKLHFYEKMQPARRTVRRLHGLHDLRRMRRGVVGGRRRLTQPILLSRSGRFPLACVLLHLHVKPFLPRLRKKDSGVPKKLKKFCFMLCFCLCLFPCSVVHFFLSTAATAAPRAAERNGGGNIPAS